MNVTERRAVASLAALYSMRMLGLFMVLPVLAIALEGHDSSTPFLIGLAIGIYGLSQALLQIPFGALSDRFGRKPLICFGLVLFALGSVIAALSEDLTGIIIGRFLQGSGAIASVLMALLSDLTSDKNRTAAMASIGMTIGLAFALAIVIGPLLFAWWGLSGLFWMTAVLGAAGILWTLKVVPTSPPQVFNREASLVKDDFSSVLRNPDLQRLDLSIFVLHFLLTALFVAIPLTLVRSLDIEVSQHGWIYLALLGASFVCMVPFIIVGEKREKIRPIFLGAIIVITLSALGMIAFQGTYVYFLAALFLFFLAFNYLEATLPSMMSKQSPAGRKGTAMGIYSTCQFLGAFCGGMVGGLVATGFSQAAVYGLCVLVSIIWLLMAKGIQPPRRARQFRMALAHSDNWPSDLQDQLRALAGVYDVALDTVRAQIYLKADPDKLIPDQWQTLVDQIGIELPK